MRNLLAYIILICLTSITTYSQSQSSYSDLGQPFIQYFSSEDIKTFPINNKITQNKAGLIYIANTMGVFINYETQMTITLPLN